jgi:plasmid segregation protein ParM
MVHSQAEAPLQWLALRADGTLDPDRNLDREAWGVIEIGHYTVDFAFCDRGNMVEHAVYSCPGMHRVSNALAQEFAAQGLPTSLEPIPVGLRHAN